MQIHHFSFRGVMQRENSSFTKRSWNKSENEFSPKKTWFQTMEVFGGNMAIANHLMNRMVTRNQKLTLATEAKALPESALSGLWGHLCMGQDDPGGCRCLNWLGGVALVKILNHQGFSRYQPIPYLFLLFNFFHFITYKNVIHHHYGHSSLCTMSILCMVTMCFLYAWTSHNIWIHRAFVNHHDNRPSFANSQ